jgi:hypothetical protein
MELPQVRMDRFICEQLLPPLKAKVKALRIPTASRRSIVGTVN